MTTHQLTQAPAPLQAPFGRDDPRALLAKAVALGGDVIAAVRPHQLHDPTPCEEYDVRQLLGHLVGVLRRVAAIGRGEDALGVPVELDGGADDGWPQAWSDAAHEVQAAWSDDATLQRPVRLPWAELPGGATLLMYTSEITVHTWDLATATGQQPAWDPQVVEAAFVAIRRGLPAEGRRARFAAIRQGMPPERGGFADPFGEVVDVPADAPLIERLVAWTGRRP